MTGSTLALFQITENSFLTFDARLQTAAQKLMPEALARVLLPSVQSTEAEGSIAMIFKLTKHQAYYEQGFFNITRKFDHLIRSDEGEIIIFAGTEDTTFAGRVDRQANGNRTARIRAKGLKDWFQKHYRLLDVVEIEIVSPTFLRIKHPDGQPSSQNGGTKP
jgi:hypothetical protein